MRNRSLNISLLFSLFAIPLVGCSAKPSLSDAEKQVAFSISSQTQGAANLSNIEKRDAVESEILGVRHYTIEYSATIIFNHKSLLALRQFEYPCISDPLPDDATDAQVRELQNDLARRGNMISYRMAIATGAAPPSDCFQIVNAHETIYVHGSVYYMLKESGWVFVSLD